MGVWGFSGTTAPSLDLVRSFNLAPGGRRALCCASLAQLTAAFRPSPVGAAAATAAGEVASGSAQQDAGAPCTAADGLPSSAAQAMPAHLPAEATPAAGNDQQQARAVAAAAAVAALVGSTAGAAAGLGSGDAGQRPHDPNSAPASQPPAAAAINDSNEVDQPTEQVSPPMEVEGAPGAGAALELRAAAAPSQRDGAASAAMPTGCGDGRGGAHAEQGNRGRCRSPLCPLGCPVSSTHAVLPAAMAVAPAIVVPIHLQAESAVCLV